MYSTMKVLVLFAIFLSVRSAEYLYPALDDYPDSCYADKFGEMQKGDEQQTTDVCGRAICREDRTIQVQTCGAVASPCALIEDLTKPYPDCCPQPKCIT